MRLEPRKPGTVRRAVTLLYLTLAVGALRSVILADRLPEGSSPERVLALMLPFFGLMLFLAYLLGRGRSWVRMVFAVWLVLNVPAVVRSLAQIRRVGVGAGLGYLQVALMAVAIPLLFLEPARGWFQEMKEWRRGT